MFRKHLKDVCFKNKHTKRILTEVLHSYKDLTQEDIQWCVNIISNTCNITNESLAEFCLKLSRTKIIGRFALTFHDTIIQYIKARDSSSLLQSITLSRQESIPEIYDNKLLTTDEISFLENIYKKEYTSILDALSIVNSKIDIQDCVLENILISDQTCVGCKDVSLYDKCYNTVCIRVGTTDEQVEDLLDFSFTDTDEVEQLICYDLLELLENILNKNTNGISEILIQSVKDKYALQLKMLSRYMKI